MIEKFIQKVLNNENKYYINIHYMLHFKNLSNFLKET